VVPELAVVGEGTQAYVWKVTAEEQAVRTPVGTGVRRDGFVEVTDGLAASDRVVIEGTVKLRADGPVRAVMAARPVSPATADVAA
jgi:hypothetical protein